MRPPPFALLLLIGAAGCGPIRSSVGLVEAERAIREAKAQGAEQRAPYPYALSLELLRKAREEQGYAAYSDSFTLAKEAKEQAFEAQRVAKGVLEKAAPPPPAGAPRPPAPSVGAPPSASGPTPADNPLPPGDPPAGTTPPTEATPVPAESPTPASPRRP